MAQRSFALSEGVEHGVLREKPALQRVGHLPAARLQHGYFVFKSLHGLFLCGQKLRSALLYAPQFGLHVLAFARHRRSFFCRNGQRRQPSCVAPGFRFAHGLPVVVLRFGVRFGTFAYLAQCVPVAFRARNAVNPPVYGCYLGLTGLEIAVGLCRVEHRRYEKRPVVAAAKQAGKGREIAQLSAVSLDNEHPEHLAAAGIGEQAAVTCNVFLHLLGGKQAQGMRLVAERVGEFCWLLYVGFKRMEMRGHCFTFLLFYLYTFTRRLYEQRKAVRGTTSPCVLFVERLFQLGVTVTCSLAKLLLYADKLVVLGHTVGAAH